MLSTVVKKKNLIYIEFLSQMLHSLLGHLIINTNMSATARINRRVILTQLRISQLQLSTVIQLATRNQVASARVGGCQESLYLSGISNFPTKEQLSWVTFLHALLGFLLRSYWQLDLKAYGLSLHN